MQINVAQLLKESLGSTRALDIDGEVDLEGDTAKVKGHVTLTRLKISILVTGEINVKLVQVCSRCQREFDNTVPFKIEEEFFPTIDINTGLPLEDTGEEGALTIDENHIIDLSEAFRQNLLVTLPMKPLCRLDCVGLCPECGADLNEVECGCKRQPEDARWAELKKVAISGEKSNNGKKG